MEVAVKTMEEGASEEERVKFLQEAAIMGQFKNHPNILRILGIVLDAPVSRVKKSKITILCDQLRPLVCSMHIVCTCSI